LTWIIVPPARFAKQSTKRRRLCTRGVAPRRERAGREWARGERAGGERPKKWTILIIAIPSPRHLAILLSLAIAVSISLFTRNKAVWGILDTASAVEPEIFGERRAACEPIAGAEIDGQRRKLTLSLWGRST